MMVAPGFKGDSLSVVPGKLYGLRAFDVNAFKGSLHGVSFPEEWKDGENKATCKHMTKKHRPHAMKDCDHGYWSYFGATTHYMASNRATAVIEGYGEIIVGEEGFRSEKARIAALVLPEMVTDYTGTSAAKAPITKDLLERVKKNARTAFWKTLIFLVLFLSFPTAVVGFMLTDYEPHQIIFGTTLIVLASLIYPLFSLGLDWKKASKAYKEFQEEDHDTEAQEEQRQKVSSSAHEEMTSLKERVMAQYPGVTIYDTLGEMLRDYQGKILIHGSVLSADAEHTGE